MDIQKGDHVIVNLAPFIGSIMRCDDSVPCEVVEVDGLQALVCTLPPYREVSLWVLSSWIERHCHSSQELAVSAELL